MNLLKSLLGYSIWVRWEGKEFVHYSWTRKEAYEWMRCYPIEAKVWITHSFGCAFHGARGFR